MKNFVDCKWVNANLENKNLRLIDCRFDSFKPDYGFDTYISAHIPNAYFLDINKDLSGPVCKHGGYRPLPEINVFKAKLESIGIRNDSTVIIYDEFLNGAPRLWWMLKYLGHDSCYILNGGINEWIAKGYSLSYGNNYVPKMSVSVYSPTIKNDFLCDIDYIRKRKDLDLVALIDSREYERYSGQYEPLYAKAGHIPGALCKPWNDCINNGFIKEKDILRELFSDLYIYEEVIFYCGSGVAACGNALVFDELDRNSKVYIGSLTDWISYEGNEVISLT